MGPPVAALLPPTGAAWRTGGAGYAGVACGARSCLVTALRRGEHIGVDVLTSQLGSRGRLWSAAWAALAALATGCILLFNGWDTVASSRMMGIITDGEVEIPLYWLQLFLPIGGGMLILVALEALARLAAGAPSLSTHSAHLEESE